MFALRVVAAITLISLLTASCQEGKKETQNSVKVNKFEKWDPTKNDEKGDWVAYDQKERLKYKPYNTIKFRLTLDVNITKDEQALFNTVPPGWIKEVKFDPKSIVGPKNGKVEVVVSVHFPDLEPWGEGEKKATGDYTIQVDIATVTTDADMTEKGRDSVKIQINVDN